MESKDYTYFTAQVLSSFSSNQDNSMLAPGFSMSLRLNRNSIIIILSGKYKYDFKKPNFKNLKNLVTRLVLVLTERRNLVLQMNLVKRTIVNFPRKVLIVFQCWLDFLRLETFF